MSDRKARSRALLSSAVSAAALAAFGGVFAAPAGAAAALPESATNCGGSLTHGKATIDDPNQIDYKFACDYSISSFTVLVNRGPNDYSTLDDFSSSVGVFEPSGVPVATEAFSCSGTIPGLSVNCNGGAGGFLPAPDTAQGTFDTTQPYCANIPPGSPAGTKPEPTALVQLIVTDTTGAQDGPFRLRLSGTCPKVKVVKAKTKETKTKHHDAK